MYSFENTYMRPRHSRACEQMLCLSGKGIFPQFYGDRIVGLEFAGIKPLPTELLTLVEFWGIRNLEFGGADRATGPINEIDQI